MIRPIDIQAHGGVLTIALSGDHLEDMPSEIGEQVSGTLADADSDPRVKAVLLQLDRGPTSKAGADCSSARGLDANGATARLLLTVAGIRKPLVAAVEGQVGGVALAVLLQCDLVYLAEDAILVGPLADAASVVQSTCSNLLSARVGPVRAFEVLALGSGLDGPTAVEWGLANAALPPGQAPLRASLVARVLASRPLGVLASHPPSRPGPGEPLAALRTRH